MGQPLGDRVGAPAKRSPSPAGWFTDSPELRSLLERVATQQRRSAGILRAHGRAAQAHRAERAASRISLTLEEPASVMQMYALSDRVARASHHRALLERALDGAITLLEADFGTMQLCDAGPGTLGIAAESGFSDAFLEHFAVVGDESSACGRAALLRRQTVIADVNADPAFAPHRRIAAAAGFRAVQSTPIVDRGGRVRGVMSTHFRRRHRPTGHELELMEWYCELVGAALARQQGAPTGLFGATAERHEESAARHAAVASLLQGRAVSLRSSTDDGRSVQLSDLAGRLRGRAIRERHRARSDRRLAGETDEQPPAP